MHVTNLSSSGLKKLFATLRFIEADTQSTLILPVYFAGLIA
jgi:hypothetical protein